MKRLIFAALLAAAAFASAPSYAANLESGVRHVRHVRTVWHGSNWRDRCAWARHYCLYAEYGFVYHYPWDDRPIARAFSARRHYLR